MITAREFRKQNKPNLGEFKSGDTFVIECKSFPNYFEAGYFVKDGKRLTTQTEEEIDELMEQYAKYKIENSAKRK